MAAGPGQAQASRWARCTSLQTLVLEPSCRFQKESGSLRMWLVQGRAERGWAGAWCSEKHRHRSGSTESCQQSGGQHEQIKSQQSQATSYRTRGESVGTHSNKCRKSEGVQEETPLEQKANNWRWNKEITKTTITEVRVRVVFVKNHQRMLNTCRWRFNEK